MKIDQKQLIKEVSDSLLNASIYINPIIHDKLKESRELASGLEKEILAQILENHELSKRKKMPLCQDTGSVVFFVEIGRELKIDFDLEEILNESTRLAYQDLRKSIVAHPLKRDNTMDNTPAIVHLKIVEGNKLDIKFTLKGAGSENVSALKMLTPGAGHQGVVDFILESIKNAGGRPCPPLIIGVGIGGNFEKCASMAKEALTRPIYDVATDEYDAKLEQELLTKINELGVGAMGVGGLKTALAVKVETYACHIASLPVAINVQCHVERHGEVVLCGK